MWGPGGPSDLEAYLTESQTVVIALSLQPGSLYPFLPFLLCQPCQLRGGGTGGNLHHGTAGGLLGTAPSSHGLSSSLPAAPGHDSSPAGVGVNVCPHSPVSKYWDEDPGDTSAEATTRASDFEGPQGVG